MDRTLLCSFQSDDKAVDLKLSNKNHFGKRTFVLLGGKSWPHLNKLTSSIDVIAISEIWNYNHWLTVTGVGAGRCYRIWSLKCEMWSEVAVWGDVLMERLRFCQGILDRGNTEGADEIISNHFQDWNHLWIINSYLIHMHNTSWYIFLLKNTTHA